MEAEHYTRSTSSTTLSTVSTYFCILRGYPTFFGAMSAKTSVTLPSQLAAYAKFDKNGNMKFSKTLQGIPVPVMSEILNFMGRQYLAGNQTTIFDALTEQCLGKYLRSRITCQFDPETDFPGYLLAANLLYSDKIERYCTNSTANKSSALPVSSKTSTKVETKAAMRGTISPGAGALAPSLGAAGQHNTKG